MIGANLHALALLLLMAVTTPSGQPAPSHPGDYTPAGKALVTGWNVKRLAPPSYLYVTGDDFLTGTLASSITGEVVTINYRLLRASDGVVVPGQFTNKILVPYSATIPASQPLSEGFLLSVTVSAAQANTRGQTWARLFLNRSKATFTQQSYALMADYVTSFGAQGFPNGAIKAPTDGTGNLINYTVANPVAGADWVFTPSTLTRFKVRAVRAVLATSAAVANRIPGLLLKSGASQAAEIPPNNVAVAGTSYNMVGINGPGYFAAVTTINLWPLPVDFVMTPSQSLSSQTTSIQAADQWSGINIYGEEWLEYV